MSPITALSRLIDTKRTLFLSRNRNYKYRASISPKNPYSRNSITITATGYTLSGTLQKLAEQLP